jgi:hypothetical protein
MGVKNDGAPLRTTQFRENRTRPKAALRLKSRGGKRNKWHQSQHRSWTNFDATRETTGQQNPITMKQPKVQDIMKSGSLVSSYWSDSEAKRFPIYLSSFGSDWTKLSAHLVGKTPIMVFIVHFDICFMLTTSQVKNYYSRQVKNGKKDWEQRVREADNRRNRGEKLPVPPPPTGRPRPMPVISKSLLDARTARIQASLTSEYTEPNNKHAI